MTTPLTIQPENRRRGGLESVALNLPLSEEQWRVGVGVTPWGNAETFVWPVSCTATPDLSEKPLQDGVELQSVFEPLVIGAGGTCGPGRGPLGDAPRILAEGALARDKYSLIAEAMFTGGTGSNESNPSLLALDGVDVLPAGFAAGSPNLVRPTIQGLLDKVCSHGGGGWVFHVPIQYLAEVDAALPGLRFDYEQGVWLYGDFLFSFDCYPNEGPADVEGATPTATDGSEFWIWLTKRPWVAFGENVTTGIGLDPRLNERIVIAEQEAIVAFDLTAVAAAKARIA